MTVSESNQEYVCHRSKEINRFLSSTVGFDRLDGIFLCSIGTLVLPFLPDFFARFPLVKGRNPKTRIDVAIKRSTNRELDR